MTTIAEQVTKLTEDAQTAQAVIRSYQLANRMWAAIQAELLPNQTMSEILQGLGVVVGAVVRNHTSVPDNQRGCIACVARQAELMLGGEGGI